MLRFFTLLILITVMAIPANAAKVTDLDALTSPANSDELYVIDKSDTTDSAAGTGKKIDLQDLYDGAIAYIEGLGHLFMTSSERTKLTGVTAGAEPNEVDTVNGDTGDVLITESFIIPASAESGDLTTGTDKVIFRMPYAFTVTAVRASVTTAPTGAAITVDINEGGVSILSTEITIDATEKTSTTAATPAIIDDGVIADDAEVSIDIGTVGSTLAGEALKVTLIGHQ